MEPDVLSPTGPLYADQTVRRLSGVFVLRVWGLGFRVEGLGV